MPAGLIGRPGGGHDGQDVCEAGARQATTTAPGRRQARTSATGAGAGSVRYELTQKTPAPGGGTELVTTFYLGAGGHRLFDQLPGMSLTKARLSVPRFGVDVFAGPLVGLLLAEVGFATDEEMGAFSPPAWVGPDVTTDSSFNGGNPPHLPPGVAAGADPLRDRAEAAPDRRFGLTNVPPRGPDDGTPQEPTGRPDPAHPSPTPASRSWHRSALAVPAGGHVGMVTLAGRSGLNGHATSTVTTAGVPA